MKSAARLIGRLFSSQVVYLAGFLKHQQCRWSFAAKENPTILAWGGGAFLGSNTNLHWSIKLIPVEVNDMVNIPLGSKESLESRSYHHYLPRFRKYLQTCLRTLPKKKRHHPHSHHPPKVLWWDAGPQHTAKLPTSCFTSTTGRRGEKEYTPEI